LIEDGFFKGRFGRLHYRRTGQGMPLLLMHSVGRSAYEFEALANELAGAFEVVAWDMPGHGDSEGGERHLSVADFSAAAVELGTALFGKPFIIAGSSIGAVIALDVAVEHPDAICGAVMIELPMTRDKAWWVNNWGMVETLFCVPDEPPERVKPKFRHVGDALAARLHLDRHKAGSKAMMAVMWAGRDAGDAAAIQTPRLKSGALFINGDKGVVKDPAAVLHVLNPSAALVLIADAGHFPQTDAPAETAAAIGRHFAMT
jgi:pimeloyl-ACP methyl ester carboxylesterase